jgi:hypothetical protein
MYIHIANELVLQMNTYIGGVTSEIVKNVERLQKLGLRKVIVNNLHPIGCTPMQSSSSNYTTCDLLGNYGSALHNNNLERLMGRKNNAHILDLYTAFTDIVNHASRKSLFIMNACDSTSEIASDHICKFLVHIYMQVDCPMMPRSSTAIWSRAA